MTLATKYKYIAVMSRFYGGEFTDTRANAINGQLLIQESAPIAVNGEEEDFTEVQSISGIGVDTLNDDGEIVYTTSASLELKAPVNQIGSVESAPWTHYSIYRTLDTLNQLNDLSSVSETFIWVDDIPAARLLYILKITNGIMAVSSGTKFIKSDKNAIFEEDSTTYKIINIITDTTATVAVKDGTKYKFPDNRDIGIWTCSGGEMVLIKKRTTAGQYVEYDTYKQFDDSYIGKIIAFRGGEQAVIKYTKARYLQSGVLDSWVIGVHEITGAPVFYDAATTIPVSRIYTDYTKDSILQSRKQSGDPLYFLQTRFFKPLPNGKLGAVIAGAYFTAPYKASEFYYCQLYSMFRFGIYHPAFQLNSTPVGSITRLKGYSNSLIIFGKNFTYYLDPTVSVNAGESLVGEYILSFGDPRLLTGLIGVIDEGSCAPMGDGTEVMMTGEPGVRIFDGQKYSENLADGLIQNTSISKLFYSVILDWNNRKGIKIWGSTSVPGKVAPKRSVVPILGGDIIETGLEEFAIYESGHEISSIIEGNIQ
jgi:hypothetical protein